jgi:Holliday junction resolvase RusA-like endonuclease
MVGEYNARSNQSTNGCKGADTQNQTMMTELQFDVHGVPAPQSGTRIVPTARGPRGISTGGRQLARWRQQVTDAAVIAHAGNAAITEPVAVTVLFRFPVPRYRQRAVNDIGWQWRVKTPDLDKLARAVGDSLTRAELVADDALIVCWHLLKIETVNWSGARIIVRSAHSWPIMQHID